jgi:hypothetical protein
MPKQDNYSAGGHQIGLVAKLELRRHFLSAYHQNGEGIRVLDCCAGEGEIWQRLKSEFKVTEYWGVDKDRHKAKAGRLIMDSSRILAQPGISQNVVDIDTDGSPWKHWLAPLAHGPAKVTAFLTYGRGPMGGGWDSSLIDSLGMGSYTKTPDGVLAKVSNQFGVTHIIGRAAHFGYSIVECREAVPHVTFKVERARHARYFGVRLNR